MVALHLSTRRGKGLLRTIGCDDYWATNTNYDVPINIKLSNTQGVAENVGYAYNKVYQ